MKNLLCPMLLALVSIATAAKADTISITLDKPTQIGATGNNLVFTGTITNLTSSTVFLNSSFYNLASNSLLVNDQFFNTVPISLAPGANSGDIELFDVGVYQQSNATGTYGLEGGSDPNASNVLGSTGFGVTVPALPPPSAPEIDPSLATSGLILIAGGIAVLRGRRIRQTA